jgi:hypothetical protein
MCHAFFTSVLFMYIIFDLYLSIFQFKIARYVENMGVFLSHLANWINRWCLRWSLQNMVIEYLSSPSPQCYSREKKLAFAVPPRGLSRRRRRLRRAEGGGGSSLVQFRCRLGLFPGSLWPSTAGRSPVFPAKIRRAMVLLSPSPSGDGDDEEDLPLPQ